MSSDLPMPSDSNESNQSTLHAASSSPSSSSSQSNNTPATAAAAASTTSSSSSSAPQPSPSPNPGDDAEEDELINNDADGDNFDEDDVTDSKPTPRKRSNGAPPAPGEALQRLNELLQRTEQFAKFVPTKAENKKARRGGGRHHDRLEEDEEDKELVQDELQDSEGKQSWPEHLDEQPSSVTKAGGLPMRDYQLEALNWMIKLHDQNLNGILADEMGLGKTLESLSLLAYLKQYRNYGGPHLIIVPKSTSSNWYREVNRWTNNLKCFKFHGNAEEREQQKPLVAVNDITITTYEMVIKEKGFFAKQKWHYIYIDEAHRIKNENSLLSRVVRSFSSEHRLLITGTPLQNNLHELWALLNFLVPQLFNSSEDFATWFELEDPTKRGEIVQRLHRLLRPFLLRRLKSDVEKALLPKIETKLFVGMSQMQKALYKKILERDIEVLNASSSSKVKLLNIVMQLRKVCNHPYLFAGQEPGPPYIEGEHLVENSSKMVLLDKLLTKLKAAGNRVLIFSQMTRILDILEDFCRYRNYEYNRIDGQTKQDERDDAMEEYNAPNSKKFVFLLSTRAGGLGINLQTADTVILFDSDWNPQMDLQAMDRAHRIGQKKQVTVFRFVVEHSIEQKMVERATKKLFLDALVVRQGRLNDSEKSVTSQELQEMVRFGANRIFQGTDSDITDADIDAILSRGTELTKAETEKLKENAGNDLLNFSLSEPTTNFQEFEGKDYKGFRSQAGFEFIEPSKRERKSNYGVDQYYRDALRVTDKKLTKSQKEWKPTQRFDYQFFNIPRLDELEKKDHESRQRLMIAKQAARQRRKEEKRIKDEREKEERRRQRYQRMRQQRLAEAAAAGTTLPEPAPGEEDKEMANSDDEENAPPSSTTPSTDAAAAQPAEQSTKMEIDDESAPAVKTEDGDAATVKSESAKQDDDTVMKNEDVKNNQAQADKKETNVDASPAPQQSNDDDDQDDDSVDEDEAKMMEEAGCLTPSEREELDHLLNEGFGSWSRRHVISFIKAMEKFGRGDLANIKQNVEDKKPEEVEKYYHVFWQNYTQIKDYDKYIKQIERGEAKLEKQKAVQRIIDQKVKRYRGNFEKMTIPYPNTNQKTFTEEEDKFLIVSLHRLGYGNWEDLKSSIRNSWMFRFDWYLKSRTCGELSKRVEYLLKLLEKEESELAEKQAAAEAKKKARVQKEAQKAIAASASTKKKKDDTSASSTSKKKKENGKDSSKSSSSKKDKEKLKEKDKPKGKSSSSTKSSSSKKKEKDSKKRKADSADSESEKKSKKSKVKTED